MRKNFTFYEQVGILIPGGVLLFGLLFYAPDLQAILTKEGIGIGSLGLFLIVAYAVGHAVGALGNLIDNLYWRVMGGMPSNWVIGARPRLLSSAQRGVLEDRVRQRLGLTIPPLTEIDVQAWFAVTRQIYSDVQRYGKPDRVDIFNGNYGLNRGLCAGLLVLALVSMTPESPHWYVTAGFVGLAVVYLYRMQRFGQHYARELFIQFLLLPPEPGKPKKKKSHGDTSARTTPAAEV